MITGVADTHTVIWYLYNDSRLSVQARQFIETTAQKGQQIGLSSITLVEMVYLIEKNRIPSASLTLIATALNESDSLFIETPVDLKIARSVSKIDAIQIPDMPDRIIAATALHWNVPVISRDAKIRASGLTTIW